MTLGQNHMKALQMIKLFQSLEHLSIATYKSDPYSSTGNGEIIPTEQDTLIILVIQFNHLGTIVPES